MLYQTRVSELGKFLEIMKLFPSVCECVIWQFVSCLRVFVICEIHQNVLLSDFTITDYSTVDIIFKNIILIFSMGPEYLEYRCLLACDDDLQTFGGN